MGNIGKFLPIALLSMPLCADAQGLDTILSRLDAVRDYGSAVTYAVTLPQAEDDVIYSLELRSATTDADRLSPADYLIDWSVTTPSGPMTGFSAYFDGHHYRLRGGKLQEYHCEWDSVPMLGENGVQRRAQFVALLPQYVAEELRRMASDTEHYTLKISDNRVSAERRAASDADTDAELTYEFDARTGLPTLFEAEYNPGAISSQTVRATYGTALAPVDELSEAMLRERYPEAFERMRQSNFAIENLPGQPLPAFSLPRVGTDGRLTHSRGEKLALPTVVVLMEAEGELTPEMIAEVRGAIDRAPRRAAVVWAFAGRDPEAALEAVGDLLPDEQAVSGARAFGAECGAAALPVLMVCDAEGTVRHVAVGLNNQLGLDVIQALAGIKVSQGETLSL